MTYKDQIKSPKWQKKRLEILNLRDFKCEKCNCEEKQLHVHHRFYLKERKAWEYDNDVFQVLCHICHENEHKKYEFDNLLKNYPDYIDVKNCLLFICSESLNQGVHFVFELVRLVESKELVNELSLNRKKYFNKKNI